MELTLEETVEACDSEDAMVSWSCSIIEMLPPGANRVRIQWHDRQPGDSMAIIAQHMIVYGLPRRDRPSANRYRPPPVVSHVRHKRHAPIRVLIKCRLVELHEVKNCFWNSMDGSDIAYDKKQMQVLGTRKAKLFHCEAGSPTDELRVV